MEWISKLLRIGHVGQTVTISGWVQMSREPGQNFVKKWTTIGQPNWGTIWEMSCWEKFRWEIWDDNWTEMPVLSWNGEDFTWFSSGIPGLWRSVHVQKPNFGGYCPWLCFNHPENSGVSKWSSWLFPPRKGQTWELPEGWGGGKLTKVDQFTSKKFGND